MHQYKSQTKLPSEKFFTRVKFSIFKTFHHTLETRTVSETLAVILIVVQFVQILSMTLNGYNSLLKVSLIQNFLPLNDYLLVYLAFEKSPSMIFNIGFLIVCTVVIAFLTFGFFYILRFKNQDDIFIKEFKNYWATLYDFLDKIMLNPLIGVALMNIQCHEPVECFSGAHFFLILWCTFLCIIFLIWELLYVTCFFNFTFKIKDGLSRNPSQFALFMLITRIILVVLMINFNLKDGNNYNIYLIPHILFGCLLMYDSLMNFPYHNKNVAKTYGSFTAAYLWLNMSLFLLNIINISMLQDNILIFIGLGLVFFVKLYLNIRNFTVKVLMNSELDEIKKDIHLDLKIRFYNNLAKTLNVKKSELLLASLLKIHSDNCKDIQNCPCRRRNFLYDPKKKKFGNQNLQMHKDDVFVKHYIIRMIKNGMSKFNNSKLLYLDYIFYSFESVRMYATLYYFIKYFEQKYQSNLSLNISFCLYRLKAKMKTYIKNKNSKVKVNEYLNVENVKIFDKYMIILRGKINTVTQLFSQMWECLSDTIPDLAKLLNICNQCIFNMQKTNEYYEELIKINDQSMELKNLMDVYATQIVFDEILVSKISKDLKFPSRMEIGNSLNQDLDFLIKKYNIFDENTGLVCISNNFENLGQITWVSKNFPKLFSYNDSEIKTLNISNLMPEIFARYHTLALQGFYLNSKEAFTNTIQHLWGMDKEGFCFSLNLIIKVVPYHQEYELMGFMHKLNDSDYILTDNEGTINTFGLRVGELMDVSPQHVLDKRLNIQLIAPRLTQYYKNYFFDGMVGNPGIDKGKMEKSQYKEIKFYLFVPNNIEDIIKFHADKRVEIQRRLGMQETGASGGGVLEKVRKDIKQLIVFKRVYGNVLHKSFKQIDLANVKKVLRIKASIQNHSFGNGSVILTAIKILFVDVKRPDFLTYDRRMKQERYMRAFMKDLKKVEKEMALGKIKANIARDEEEEEEKKSPGENKDREEESPARGGEKPADTKLKGIISLFKKKSIFGGIFGGANANNGEKKDNNNQLSKEPSSHALTNGKKRNSSSNIFANLGAAFGNSKAKLSKPIDLNNPFEMKPLLDKNKDSNEENVNKDKEMFDNQQIGRRTFIKQGTFLKDNENASEKTIGGTIINKTTNVFSKQTSIMQDKGFVKMGTLNKNSNPFDFEKVDEDTPKTPPKVVQFSKGHKLRDLILAKGLNRIIRQFDEEPTTPPLATNITKTESSPSPNLYSSKPSLGFFQKLVDADKKRPEFEDNMQKGLSKVKTFKTMDKLNTMTTMKLSSHKSSQDGSSESSEDENSEELDKFLKSDVSSSKKDKNERRLLEKIELGEKKDEDEQRQSVASSAISSLAAQNSLRMIKASLRNQKTSKILLLSNGVLLFLCLAMSAITLTQYLYTYKVFGNMEAELKMVNDLSFYNENLMEFYNFYLTLENISNGFYSTEVFTKEWLDDAFSKIKLSLHKFLLFSLDELSSDSETSLRTFLFNNFMPYIRVNKQNSQIPVNFQSFVRLFSNALNLTLSLNPKSDYTTPQIENDDYLYFIFKNIDTILEIFHVNNDFINNNLNETMSKMILSFLYIWIVNVIIVFFAFAVVVPIVLKSQIKIHDTLVLFTKISLRNVDFYSNHYKQILLMLSRIEDSGEFLKEVEKVVENENKFFLKQKGNDASSLSRSRKYKGIKINRLSFLLKTSLIFGVFLSIIIIKDVNLFIFLQKEQILKDLYIDQSDISYDVYRNLIFYKMQYMDHISQDSLVAWKGLPIPEPTLANNPNSLFANLYREFKGYDPSYDIFMNNLLTMDVCDMLKFSSELADQTGNGLWKIDINGLCNEQSKEFRFIRESLINILIEFQFILQNGVLQIHNYANNLSVDEARSKITDNFKIQMFKELDVAARLIQSLNRVWGTQSYKAFLKAKNDQLNVNKIVLIIFLISLWLFVLLGWLRHFNNLKNNSKWVNGFIILIPLSLIKENQHLKIFLKKKMNVKSLQYF